MRRAAGTDERQRQPVPGRRPAPAHTLPAHARGAAHPPHPHADRHALDQWQGRGVLGDAPSRGPGPSTFRSLAQAEAAVVEYAGYYNLHRLHGEIGWLMPAERYAGAPFV